MQSISVFLDITKVTDFQSENADVSRTHGVYHVIYIFLDLLKVSSNCAKFHQGYVWQIFRRCGEGGGVAFAPLFLHLSSSEKAHPEYDQMKIYFIW